MRGSRACRWWCVKSKDVRMLGGKDAAAKRRDAHILTSLPPYQPPGGPMRRAATVIFIIAAAAAALLAQIRETVNVNVIEVPVTVVDSSGNPIRGLTAANFELLDQGKKRQVTSFDKIDFGAAESVTAISPLNPAARRTFLLLFDLGFSTPKTLARAQDAARAFVKENVQPRDLIGVGTIDIDKGFRLLSAFTTDRELIASAINDP